MKLPYVKKADILLLVLLVLAAGGLFALQKSEAGSLVRVTVDGKTVKTCSLQEDADFEIATEYGRNRIVIQGGQVRVLESDCRGGQCMAMGPIGSAGQVILCLPHRMSVAVEGADAPDVVLY